MPEADKEGERYQANTPQTAPGLFLKGCHQLDWGMKNRLARTFNPASGRTVMLAIDHGYFQGPTSGLERIDLSILPLLPQCDALFCTRGVLRSIVPADSQKPMVLRASAARASFATNSPTSRSPWTWTTRCGSTRRASVSRCSSAATTRPDRSTT
jgi:hypothetical protein